MAEIKTHYKQPMSLNQAIESRMDEDAFEAYLSFHQVSITRRDE